MKLFNNSGEITQSITEPGLIICLCLAGLGSRFTDEGYKQPKYLLPGKDGKPILSKIIRGFDGVFGVEIILVLNFRHQDWDLEVQKISAQFVSNITWVYISDTNGQAHTAKEATECIKDFWGIHTYQNTPLIFHNGDTVLYNRNLKQTVDRLRVTMGVVDTFHSEKPQFSYVAVTNGGVVKRIVEKVVISDRASSGFYGFKNSLIYRNYYDKTNFGGEHYISGVYRSMIEEGEEILNIHFADELDTLVLGSPSEYEAYLDD